MLRGKTIMSKEFPKLGGLPDDVREEMLKKENDGAFLFAPAERFEKESSYRCLRCGAHGKAELALPVCPDCGNSDARTFRKGNSGERGETEIRLVTTLDNYTVVRDFYCRIVESEENGIDVREDEHTRIFIKGSDMLAFSNGNRYMYGRYEPCWQKTDQPYGRSNKSARLIYDSGFMKHPQFADMLEPLSWRTDEMCKALKLIVSGTKTADLKFLPEVDFPKLDYSLIRESGDWEATGRSEPVEGAGNFVRMHSWCSNCGKYFEQIKEKDRYGYHDDHSCLHCGSGGYYSHITHYLVDAVGQDGDAVLRISCVSKKRVFSSPLIIGVDPKVETVHEINYTNYVLVRADGAVTFFDDNRQSIDKLQMPEKFVGQRDQIHYSDTAKAILENSKAIARTGFNCGYEHGISPKFLEKLKDVPCLEIFAKFGFYPIVNDIIQKPISDIPAYFRKPLKESKIGKLTKPQIKSMKESVVTLKHLVAYMQALNKDKDALYGDFYDLACRSHERHILDVLRVGIPGMTVSKICDYIKHVDDFQCCPANESMQLWPDYLRMLRDSDCDLTDQRLIYPNSLKREHDKMSRKITQIKDEKLSGDFEERASSNEWLAFRGKKLSAIIPKQLTELYEEGRKLNHCVGSYARSVVDGKCIIAFLRKNDDLDSPYCTVEVRGKHIVQARGYSNRLGNMIPGVSDFLKDWANEKQLQLDVA